MNENTKKEFQVNEHLALKLEREKTNIYVDGELFNQCKYLLIIIPVDEVERYEEIDSIDEAKLVLNHSLERGNRRTNNEPSIPSEIEFWAHCSNMQAWAENDYDTRLLDSRLAFPLLKRLTEVGDPIARRVFSEEIATRFSSNFVPTIQFLLNENYLAFLSKEELEALLDKERILQLCRIEVRAIDSLITLFHDKGLARFRDLTIDYRFSQKRELLLQPDWLNHIFPPDAGFVLHGVFSFGILLVDVKAYDRAIELFSLLLEFTSHRKNLKYPTTAEINKYLRIARDLKKELGT